MSISGGKWAAAASYGPVLSRVELHMFKRNLEIHPILANSHGPFRLIFNIVTGRIGRLSHDERDQELPFEAREEPATLPRVEELLIITPLSPWCSTVRNPKGVTIGDMCVHLWKDYSEQRVTEAEMSSLSPQIQEDIKQASVRNKDNGLHYPAFNGGALHTADGTHYPSFNEIRRVDWLREQVFFEALRKDDNYAVSRLGFKAPNILVADFLN